MLPSMYTQIDVRPLDSDEFQWSGHAYDLSEGGMRFELDQPIEPGTAIAVRIRLPGDVTMNGADRRPLYALANVVWLEDEDVELGGPVRMACVFREFVLSGDLERLQSRLHSGRYSMAA